MTAFSRRRFLGATGAAAAAPLIAPLLGAAPDTRRAARCSPSPTTSRCPPGIPTIGASAVNPTIQSIYKAVFDSYIDQNPDLSFKPGLLTKWGWNKDRTKVLMTVRKGAFWHDGTPVTPEDVVWSLERAGDPEERQPDPVRMGQDRQLQDRGRQHHRRREGVRADAVQVDGVSHRLCAAEEGLHRGRRGRLRGEADRLRAVHGGEVRAQRVHSPEGISEVLGPQARVRDRSVQARARCHQPLGRSGERRLRSHARSPVSRSSTGSPRSRISPAWPIRYPTSA